MIRLAAFALIVLAVPAGVAARPSRHAATDWSRTVSVTPAGGWRMGDPQAKVQLVEYGSFTCTHCAAFARDASAAIRDRYVRTGRVSFEFRPALRDRGDIVAALTVVCGGPSRFFGNADAVFAQQDQWFAKLASFDADHPVELSGATAAPAIAALTRASGLAEIAAKRGIAAPELQRCLADQAALGRLSAAAEQAWNETRIGGTPAFYLNGDKLDGVYGWAGLEPNLQAALKR